MSAPQKEKEIEAVQREKTQNGFKEIANEMRPIVLWVAVGMLLGILGGLLFLMNAPQQWEANALLRVGLTSRDHSKTESIESQANIVERIRADSFKHEVVRLLEANYAWAPNDSSLLRRTLKAAVVPGTDLVRISARGSTPEAAKLAVDTVASRLRSTHAQMIAPFLQNIEQRLAYVESRIANENAELLRIEGEIEAFLRQRKAETAQVLLLHSMLADASKQLDTSERERLDLLRTIKSVRTSPTAPIVPVFSRSEPVSPSRFKVLVMAGVLGGIFGCLLAWYRMRTERGDRVSG